MAFRRRLLVLFLLACAGMGVVWLRVLEMQVLERDLWVSEARARRLWTHDLPAPRGRILDVAGGVVAQDVPVPQLVVTGTEWQRRQRLRCGACGAVHFYDGRTKAEERRTRPSRCPCGAQRSRLEPLAPGDLAPLEAALGLPEGRLAQLAQARCEEVARLVDAYERALVAGDEPDFLVEDAVKQRRQDLLQRPFVVVGRLPQEALRLVELDDEGRYRGFHVRHALRRAYDGEGPPGQLLGFVSVVHDEEELERLRQRYGRHVRLDTRRGRAGVERAHEDLLLGHRGEETLERDEDGAFTVVVAETAPRAGKTLRLTLSSEACRQAQAAMEAEADRAEYAPRAQPSGGFVAMDAQTGAIVAWSELPRLVLAEDLERLYDAASGGARFDADVGQWLPGQGGALSGGETLDAWRLRLSKPAPLPLSRVASIAVEPGSTLKAFIGLGLLEGLSHMEAGTPLPLEAVYGSAFPCASIHMTPGCHAHADVGFTEALQFSCNRYFALSLRQYSAWWEVYRRTVPALLLRLGFGRTTGVDVAGETAGMLLRDLVDFDPRTPAREAVARLAADGVRVTLALEPRCPARVAGRGARRLEDAIVAALAGATRAVATGDALLRLDRDATVDAAAREVRLRLVLAVRLHPDGPSSAATSRARAAIEEAFAPLDALVAEAPAVPGALACEVVLRYHEPIGRTPGEGLVILPDDGRNVAIGQGPLAVTPLQMVRAVAALANGGRLVTPHVVGWADGVPLRTPVDDLGLDDRDVERVREGLRAAVEDPGGTAYERGFEGVPATVYGKTGTAQPGPWWTPGGATAEGGPWHHWFVGFAEAPGLRTIAFACVLHAREEAAAGGTAAPAVASFLRWWFREGPDVR